MKTTKYSMNSNIPFARLIARVRFVFFLSGLVLTLIVGTWVWQSWRATEQKELDHLSTMVEMSGMFLDSYFSERESLISRTGEQLIAARNNPRELSALLKNIKNSDPEYDFVTIAQPDGQLLASDTIDNPRDLPNVQTVAGHVNAFHEINTGKTFDIGRPVKAKINGHWVTPLRFGIHNARGQLVLVLNCALSLSATQKFWQYVTLPAETTMGVLRNDGFLISRLPAPGLNQLDDIFGRPRDGELVKQLISNHALRRGTVLGLNSVTKTQNLFAFRRLSQYPLTVFVSSPVKSIRNQWVRQIASPLVIFFLAFLVGFVLYRNIIYRYLQSLEHEKKRVQTETRLQQAASVFHSSGEGIVIANADATLLDVNEAFTRITGFSKDEVIGELPGFIKSGLHPDVFYRDIFTSVQRAGEWNGEVWDRKKNGSVYLAKLTVSSVSDQDGDLRYLIGLFHDITETKAQQEQLERLAHYDALTHLPNRSLLADRLRQAMVHAIDADKHLAVLYLDLDGFKEVNDKFGHANGDQLLVQFSKRIAKSLAVEDTLARLGGDEFVIVLQNLNCPDDALSTVLNVMQLTTENFIISDVELNMTASMGVVFYPQADNVDPDQLLRQADQAMYLAKRAGKNRFHVFDEKSERKLREQHELIQRISDGLAAGEFALYYQPKVNLRSGDVLGFEALIRWNHPERGVLSPASFLPVIEDHPLIITLGDWVINAALEQMSTWKKVGIEFPVSINVAALQLYEETFMQKLASCLGQHAAVANLLELEIVETVALHNIDHVSAIIEQCRDIGIKVAIDDFGTGYSSLVYLKKLPAEIIKIDQGFVRDMLGDVDDLTILEAIIGLANSFRRTALAEGVETAHHAMMLVRMGCEAMQGYFIARPMPASQLAAWLAEWKENGVRLAMPAIEREDFPILFAMTEHRAWVNSLKQWIRNERAAPLTLDHTKCNFGKWLHGSGTRYQDCPSMPLIAQRHKEIHQDASNLEKAVQTMGRDVASTQYSEQHFDRLRDDLLNLMQNLLDEHAALKKAEVSTIQSIS